MKLLESKPEDKEILDWLRTNVSRTHYRLRVAPTWMSSNYYYGFSIMEEDATLFRLRFGHAR